MNTPNQNQVRQSDQSAAGSASTVQISGSPETVRRLKKAYQVREVLSPEQAKVFDQFVICRGVFGKTEALVLDKLASDSVRKKFFHLVLKKVIDHFGKYGWPKGSKAIWVKVREFSHRAYHDPVPVTEDFRAEQARRGRVRSLRNTDCNPLLQLPSGHKVLPVKEEDCEDES